MTAPRITTEAVEAAAKRYWQMNGDDRQWGDLVPVEQDQLRFEAREVVEAALPLLASQPVVDRETLMRLLHNKGAWCGTCDYEDGIDACEDCRKCLGSYADAVLALINGSES